MTEERTLAFDASFYAGLCVLVTGASGFIGRWVARALTAAGADLVLGVRDVAMMRRIARDHHIHGVIVPLGLRSQSEVRTVVAETRPDVIFNLAGYGVDRAERDESTSYRVNAFAIDWLGAALAEVSAASSAPQQLVHVGSALEYGALGGNLREDRPGRPVTLYGTTKLAGTKALQRRASQSGIRCLTARLFTVYGPGEHSGRLLPSLLDAAQANTDLRLSAGTQRRDFTYVEDVAEGLLRLGISTVAPGSIVNLATGRLQTVRRFVETAAGVLDIPRHRLKFGTLDVRSDEMTHEHVCIDRLHAATGWHPAREVAVGVRAALEFSRDHDVMRS